MNLPMPRASSGSRFGPRTRSATTAMTMSSPVPMLNIGTGELIVIAVVALLVLGPKRLPELARGIGKFMREFRRQTDEVRGVVEREFYKMDQEVNAPPPAPPIVPQPAPGLV